MGTRDPRIDAYIAKAAPFAQPILRYLRDTVHEACPSVEETLKWSSPSFMYHGILCGMAAFKEHCAFGFWKSSLVVGDDGRGNPDNPMGSFGRITALEDLPPKRDLVRYIKKAMVLNEEGVKTPRERKGPRPPLPVPAYLKTALAKNRKAKATFDSFTPSAKREYVEWITEAKTDATRDKRLAQAIEWMAEGKQRNWKYQR